MATAVSLRKGSTAEHEEFKGDLGEVTVDTDIGTLYVHLGDKEKGRALAKADMTNVDAEDIAKRGIAKTDLTNVTIPSESINDVRSNLSNLTYAQTDGTDIHTNAAGGLADTTRNSNLFGKALAYADLENVEKEAITEKGIAQTDLANVTTETVVNKLTVEGEHLYANKQLDNINTENLATGAGETGKHAGLNLAYANLSNLETLSDATKEALYNNEIQLTSKLVQDVDIGTDDDYPSATAVQNKIATIAKLPTFNLRGTESYQVLITSFAYSYSTELNEEVVSTFKYNVNDLLNLVYPDGRPTGITLNILSVNADGSIDEYESLITHGNSELNGTFNVIVNEINFASLPSLQPDEEGKYSPDVTGLEDKLFTINEPFETNIDFAIGEGISEVAGTKVRCVNTGDEEQPSYKWVISTEENTTIFNVTSTETGVTPGINTQTSWVNLENPITIRDTEMEDETGKITVTFSRMPTQVKVKKLIGGDDILGTWSLAGITMTFTPDIPADVLLDSWVIKVD